MKKEHLMKALEIITNTQHKGDGIGGCAPVKIGIGYTDKDNIVRDGLVIYDCPPVLITNLLKEGYDLSAKDGRIYVIKFQDFKRLPTSPQDSLGLVKGLVPTTN